MNNKLSMRIRNCRADFAEQLKAFRDPQPVGIAIFVDRKALDVFHDEIRLAIFGRPAIEQARDVKVIETSENLPLLAEMTEHRVSIHPTFDQLDRNLLLVLLVGALG